MPPRHYLVSRRLSCSTGPLDARTSEGRGSRGGNVRLVIPCDIDGTRMHGMRLSIIRINLRVASGVRPLYSHSRQPCTDGLANTKSIVPFWTCNHSVRVEEKTGDGHQSTSFISRHGQDIATKYSGMLLASCWGREAANRGVQTSFHFNYLRSLCCMSGQFSILIKV